MLSFHFQHLHASQGPVIVGLFCKGKWAQSEGQRPLDKSSVPWYPNKRSRTGLGDNQGSQWPWLLDKFVVMDLVWSQDRKASQQVSIAQGQAQVSLQYSSDKDHGQDWAQKQLLSLGETPNKASPGSFSHTSFPAAAPKVIAVLCQSWSWALAAKAAGGKRLQNLLVHSAGWSWGKTSQWWMRGQDHWKNHRDCFYVSEDFDTDVSGQFSLQFRSSYGFFCYVKVGHPINYNR